MFAIPQIVTLPVLTSLGSGAASWPTVGGVFAWMLIAALIGSFLGILREYARGGTTARRPLASVGLNPPTEHVEFHADHTHQEAA